jgi:rare lipoprotein A
MTSPAPPSCCNSRRGRRRHGAAALQAALLAGLLSACSSTPPPPPPGRSEPAPRTAPPRLSLPPSPDTDGPEANPPPDLHLVPDAEPRIEPVRPGGPNNSYAVDPPLVERGLASWYGRKFHGRPTASGEAYNMYAMTAAHKTMPLPSYARVRNPANGREVVVRVNDRGPFHPGRVVDLSYTAALKLGLLGGVATVEVERITQEAIRSGSWRQPGAAMAVAAADPLPAAVPVLRADPPPGRSPRPAPDDPLADPIGDLLQRAAAAARPVEPRSAEPLPPETAAPAQAAAKAAPGFWLQLGAFGQAEGALQFQQRVAGEVAWLAPLLAVFSEQRLHRLQAGPYASRAQAQAAAQRLRDQLQLVPAVVERR